MPRLSNAKLADLGREYLVAKRAEAEAKGRKQAVAKQLLAELDRRKATQLVVLGVQLTKKASTVTSYGVDQVKATLGRRARRFLITAVDVDALRSAARAGELTPNELAGCVADQTTKAPYVDVTDLEAA